MGHLFCRQDQPRLPGGSEDFTSTQSSDIIYVGTLHTQHRDIVLLFLQARKNVLCEKPLAMNAKEVKELVTAARKNNVFLMEGLWTRFFPVSEQIRALLLQKTLGEVKLVRAEFGNSIYHLPRLVEKELGGGVLLDIGCYCIQFACMVFGGEKPESITATGFQYETGVEETVTIILQYSGKRQAILTNSFMVPLPNEAAICCSDGIIKVPGTMWCPTSLVVNGKETKYPLPPTTETMNFTNSTGLSYEAEHVRQCLLKGLKESPILSLADSELVAYIIDEARKQLGDIPSK
uniref:Trans-1,2-dihydrobenzene-1,2-diol dehydrogenase n=1 Tax=Geotrypetes seraphini TaxID=260995 RepID=A0A6P8SEI8_GEOSA|nr:trans-1,2-dihydrobenzene-1,2-diol dehydrogenase isoform X2 [Geotrypetes seraphini]